MKPHVLIAETDSLHAAACRAFLAVEGVECEVVSTGLDCLAAIRNQCPDVLLLDLDLLWGSGLGVLAILRQEEKLAEVPVLVMTDRPGQLVEVGLTGREIILLRPVTPLTVTLAVVEILHNCLASQDDTCLVVEEEKAVAWS